MTSFSSEGGEKVDAKDGGTQSGDGRNKIERFLMGETQFSTTARESIADGENNFPGPSSV